MDLKQTLEVLAERGADITAEDGRLLVSPPAVVDAPLRAAIAEHKPALLDLLQSLTPPEPAPTHPSWRTPAIWNAEHGVWQRCGGLVPTDATRENVHRYLRRRKGD